MTAAASGTNTTVHIVWDAMHRAYITRRSQLSSFLLGQDYHLI